MVLPSIVMVAAVIDSPLMLSLMYPLAVNLLCANAALLTKKNSKENILATVILLQ